MAIAHCSIGQRRAGVRALSLIRANLIAMAHQYNVYLANFNLNAAILTKIDQASDSVHWHITFLPGFLLGVGRG
jgi:hypothetical protein